jgi:hypothetical protein
MEDYEMMDRLSIGSKYRYKRTFNDLMPSDSDNFSKTEKKIKYVDNSDNKLTFNRIASNADVEMAVVKPEINKR